MTPAPATAAFEEAPTEKADNWKILRRLLALCAEQKGRVVRILILQMVLLGMQLVGLSFIGAGVDFLKFTFTEAEGVANWPLAWVPPEAWSAGAVLAFAVGAALLAAFLRSLLMWWATRDSAILIHEYVVPKIRRQVFQKLQQLHFGYFDTQTSGGLINRVTGDITAIRLFAETIIIDTVILILTVAIYIGFMAQISPFLTVVCLATLPLMVAVSLIFSKVIRPQYLERKKAFDHMILFFAESVRGVQSIFGFSREPEMREQFKGRNDRVVDQQKNIFLSFSIFQPVVHLFTHINIIVLLLVGGKMAIDGQLDVGAGLFVFAVLLQQLQNQVGTLTNVANTVQDSFSAAERVFEVLDRPSAIFSRDGAEPVSGRVKGSIRYEDVSFSFSSQRSTLQNISIAVEPGQTVAIVGETGSGKTALLSLLPRFYDPDEGRILLDGKDLRDLDLVELRQAVGVVFQEPLLFSDTIEGNIKFGHEGATAEQMLHASKQAAAHEFIETMDAGYQTIVEESGVNLSGGQRQRIALARALMTDPKILVLDDPTSAIDPETEDEILTAINRVIESRTTFIVAHRLSTLKRADQIIVLRNGGIVESGTHESLIAQRGEYARAAAIQMIDSESRDALNKIAQQNSQGGSL
ncbi:MAG: ABC transporter ATP-binding protein [Opitutales bacterium]